MRLLQRRNLHLLQRRLPLHPKPRRLLVGRAKGILCLSSPRNDVSNTPKSVHAYKVNTTLKLELYSPFIERVLSYLNVSEKMRKCEELLFALL